MDVTISCDEPMATHTPGPWQWFGNAKGNNLYLSTVHHGRRIVMDFCRWGMARAQPRFQERGVMKPAVDFLTFEVGDHGIVGYEKAKGDASVYRYDIAGIDHPDARLIAASPDLLEACQKALGVLGSERPSLPMTADEAERFDAVLHLTAAIAKATGQEAASC